jgi:hypothetical protein
MVAVLIFRNELASSVFNPGKMIEPGDVPGVDKQYSVPTCVRIALLHSIRNEGDYRPFL